MARSRMSPGAQIIMGIIFLIVSLVIPFYTYHKMIVTCNSNDKDQGMCIITTKGLVGESTQRIATSQIDNITYQQIRKSSKNGYYYRYKIVLGLQASNNIVLPIELPEVDRDILLQQFKPFSNGYDLTKVVYNYDNGSNTLFMTGFLVLMALIMIVTAFFRKS